MAELSCACSVWPPDLDQVASLHQLLWVDAYSASIRAPVAPVMTTRMRGPHGIPAL